MLESADSDLKIQGYLKSRIENVVIKENHR